MNKIKRKTRNVSTHGVPELSHTPVHWGRSVGRSNLTLPRKGIDSRGHNIATV